MRVRILLIIAILMSYFNSVRVYVQLAQRKNAIRHFSDALQAYQPFRLVQRHGRAPHDMKSWGCIKKGERQITPLSFLHPLSDVNVICHFSTNQTILVVCKLNKKHKPKECKPHCEIQACNYT